MLSKKFGRRSGEKEEKNLVSIKTKGAIRQLGRLKPLHTFPIGRIDLQIQSLNKASNDLSINFDAVNEDAQKILKEAATEAKKRKAPTKT